MRGLWMRQGGFEGQRLLQKMFRVVSHEELDANIVEAELNTPGPNGRVAGSLVGGGGSKCSEHRH